MGMQAEFNWYIVLKDNNVTEPDDILALRERAIQTKRSYLFTKSDYRIYPIDTPLPLIYNGKCLAMGVVTNLTWNCNKTIFNVQPILVFNENDSAAQFYETSFAEYKQQQESIDDGGKVDLRTIANLETRKRF